MPVLSGVQVSQQNARSFGGNAAASSSDCLWERTGFWYSFHRTWCPRQTWHTNETVVYYCHPSLCLHRHLLDNSADSTTHTLHNHKDYRVLFATTNKFQNSFLLHALWNFHWVIIIFQVIYIYCIHMLLWHFSVHIFVYVSFYRATWLQDK